MRVLSALVVAVGAMAACTAFEEGESDRVAPVGSSSSSSSSSGTSPADAGASSSGADGAVPPAKCTSGPFGTPALVPGLPKNTQCLVFNADETMAYYSVNGSLFSTVPSNGGFEPGLLVVAEGEVKCSTFGPGGVTLYHEHGVFQLASQTKTAIGSFAQRTPIANEGLDGASTRPFYDLEGDRLYVGVWNTLAPGFAGIAAAPVTDGVVGAYVKVDIDGDTTAHNPILTRDGLTIYYASKRDSSTADTDVWMATRPSREQPFGNGQRVANVNTSGIDDPSWISNDGCTLYVASLRTFDGGFEFGMSAATRTP